MSETQTLLEKVDYLIDLFDQWDQTIEQAEAILAECQQAFDQSERLQLDAQSTVRVQVLVGKYQQFMQQVQLQKQALQREMGKLNQAKNVARSYIQPNDSSGYEFYY